MKNLKVLSFLFCVCMKISLLQALKRNNFNNGEDHYLDESDIGEIASELSRSGPHPLDPLSSNEIEVAAKIIKQEKPRETWVFNTITLKEPKKKLLLPFFLTNWNPPQWIKSRRATVILSNKETGRFYEATVNLRSKTIESFDLLDRNDKFLYTNEDNIVGVDIAKSDSNVIQRCADLGFHNMSLVFGSLWSLGYLGDRPEWQDRRLIQVLFFGQQFPEDNPYAHPFPFMAVVDLHKSVVVDILNFPTHDDSNTENQRGNRVPREVFNYDQSLRPDLHLRDIGPPVYVRNPNGLEFKIHGRQIEWQKYKFHLGFNSREGVIINQLAYQDGGYYRPILYRASIVETFVPYGDPRFPYTMKMVFDETEFGLGYSSISLTAGEDCTGTVHFLNGVFNDENGKPFVTSNAVCISVEDAGVLWKHTDEVTNRVSIARSHRLSIHFNARLGNYEYLFYWYLYQDGSIQFVSKPSGIVISTMVAEGSEPPVPISGTLLTPRLLAPIHQHIFAARLDMDIDGVNNKVSLVDTHSHPAPTGSPENPYGMGIVVTETPLTTAEEGKVLTSPQTSRVVKIASSDQPTSYVLRPENLQRIAMKADSPVRRTLAGFTDYDFWVTRYNDNQRYPAGVYINGNGLPQWVEEDPNACITSTDIVLYHVFALTHLVRIEDNPLMTTMPVGFMLMPANFFNENPSLDVPNIHRNSKNEL